MKRNSIYLLSLSILLSLALSSCIGLIPIDNKPANGNYGPSYDAKEHQTRTFEALWKDLQENYIYYDSSKVNWDPLHEKYLQRINAGLTNEQFTALLHELETELPAGTLVYQSRTERIEGDTADTSSYEGIGAFIGFSKQPAPHIILLSVIAGSPAEAAGLKAHDSIFKIDGNPIQADEGLNAVNRIRGPAGSSVTLNVQTPGKPVRSIELKRAKLVSTGTLEASLISGKNYGYILFPPITYDAMVQDVLKSLQTFETNRTLEGLILDLRIAGSARGWPLQELLTLFQNGTVGEFYNIAKQKQVVTIKGQDSFSSQTVPLIILVGQNTDGFPEIFAASLQTNHRATVIGAATPGDVETQSAFYLPDGSRIYTETASFRLSTGEEIGNTGVNPNVQMEPGWDEVVPEQDPILEKAIELLGEPQ